MTHKKDIIDKDVENKRQIKVDLSATFKFVAVALIAVLGYIAGIYHYRIEAAIAPVFGYRAYSGTIDLTSLQETYNALARNFDGDLDINKLISGASRGLVEAAGDEYTMYLDATDAEEYNKSLSGEIGGGIGVEVGVRKDRITIVNVLKGNTAKAAGVLAGDVLLGVNDDAVSDWTVEQTVAKIRGDVGTTVKLTVEREGAIKTFTITRAEIDNPSVRSEISGKIGILTILRFDNETGDLARLESESLISQGAQSIILDLRSNGGGYVEAARAVAGLWLDDKKIVTEKTTLGQVKATIITGKDAILDGFPTVVLVNGSTASASEIVAGALKDYGAATLVGDQTYGKGSVQKLINLSDKALLKVTVARWFTPKDQNISGNGIIPNKIVGLTSDDLNNDRDPQMDEAKNILL